MWCIVERSRVVMRCLRMTAAALVAKSESVPLCAPLPITLVED
jgi:hypothetical protein